MIQKYLLNRSVQFWLNYVPYLRMITFSGDFVFLRRHIGWFYDILFLFMAGQAIEYFLTILWLDLMRFLSIHLIHVILKYICKEIASKKKVSYFLRHSRFQLPAWWCSQNRDFNQKFFMIECFSKDCSIFNFAKKKGCCLKNTWYV